MLRGKSSFQSSSHDLHFHFVAFVFIILSLLFFFLNQLISVVSKAKLQGDRCIAKREVSLFSDKLGLFAESILSYII